MGTKIYNIILCCSIAFSILSCRPDEVCPIDEDNMLRGKISQIRATNGDADTILLMFNYDESTGYLLRVLDSSSNVVISFLYNGTLLTQLDYAHFGSYTVESLDNYLIHLNPISPENPLNAEGQYNWKAYYNSQQLLDSVIIDMQYRDIVPPQPTYKNGKLQIAQLANTSRTIYTYERNNVAQSDTIVVTYSEFEAQNDLPGQLPFSSFDLNSGHLPIFEKFHPIYLLRLCGIKLIPDSEHLIASNNQVNYSYEFNAAGKVSKIKMDNVPGYPTNKLFLLIDYIE